MSNASVVTSLGIGTCFAHTPPIVIMGNIVTGSPNVSIANLASARNTDIVLSFCGHVGILVTGSSTVSVNNLQKTRIGSLFSGVFLGNIITGIGTVEVGG